MGNNSISRNPRFSDKTDKIVGSVVKLSLLLCSMTHSIARVLKNKHSCVNIKHSMNIAQFFFSEARIFFIERLFCSHSDPALTVHINTLFHLNFFEFEFSTKVTSTLYETIEKPRCSAHLWRPLYLYVLIFLHVYRLRIQACLSADFRSKSNQEVSLCEFLKHIRAVVKNDANSLCGS